MSLVHFVVFRFARAQNNLDKNSSKNRILGISFRISTLHESCFSFVSTVCTLFILFLSNLWHCDSVSFYGSIVAKSYSCIVYILSRSLFDFSTQLLFCCSQMACPTMENTPRISKTQTCLGLKCLIFSKAHALRNTKKESLVCLLQM